LLNWIKILSNLG